MLGKKQILGGGGGGVGGYAIAQMINPMYCLVSHGSVCLQSTFGGRLRHFMDVVDPRTLFTSKVRETGVMYQGA